ncbi:MAG: response regulator transcription factor [Actinomycetota bacterium]|nr:response regulator transcription factor [Actinomycetota bacterium]
MKKIRILLAEDHTFVRESLKQYLEKEGDLEVVGEAADGEQMVDLARELRPDIIVADVAMPKLSGIEATKQIRALNISVPILILTAYDIDQYIVSLLDSGAAGYLLKDISGKELIDSIRRVARGESVLHPVIMRKVIDRFVSKSKVQTYDSYKVLTDREIEILGLASQGKSNKEIADKLYVSVRTVEAHLGHIFDKLGVNSRTEAVIVAFKKGWVGLD